MTRLLSLAALAFLAACAALPAFPPPARTPTVTPLAVNTTADEDEPLVAGNTLYYASNAKGKFDIMTATRRNPAAQWGRGQVLEDVQTEADDRGAFPFTDREGFQYLYFATRKDKDQGNFDLYVAQRIDSKHAFSSPTPINSVDSEADEMHPWLTADGKQLFFSRKTKQGWRVMIASRSRAAGAAGFGEPALVEELPADFHHATVTPDSKTMFLQGPVGKGRWGIFRSTKSAGVWTEPEPLSLVNNAEGERGDLSPCLTRDGNVLYFASDRPGGKGGLDLWWIAVRNLPPPEKK